MLTQPLQDDALLTRDETAEALTDKGYPIRPATLATMATRGGGPPYRMFGRVPVYPWRTSLAWARGRLTMPRSRSAEVATDWRRDLQVATASQIAE